APRHLRYHIATDSIIKSTSNQPLLIELHQLILKRDYTTHMNPHGVNLLLAGCPNINKDILQSRRLLLTYIAHVDSGPPEHTFDDTVVRMNVDALAWRYLMVGTTIASDIDISVIGNVVHKPGYLIGMCLDHYLVTCLRIDYPYHGAIYVNRVVVHIRLEILEPYFLSFRFEASGGSIVKIRKEKFFA